MYDSNSFVRHADRGGAPARAVVMVAPPPSIEVGYYAVLVYAVMCNAWHISVPLAGAGSLALLALICSRTIVLPSAAVRRALVLPILCAVSFVVIQLLVHGESLRADFVTTFSTWIASAVIVHSLVLRRGFLHRFALVCFCIGLMTLPYTRFVADTGSTRLALDPRLGIANPNDLGAWFGFCCVYFVTVGIESRRLSLRVIAAVCAIVSLMLLGLTVSRGPLIGVALSSVVAFRRVLKRGFVPVLVLTAALCIAYAAGFFDPMIVRYEARGTVESGRLVTWPLIVERFLGAPFFGVGVSDVATFVPSQSAWLTPHNAYLFFPLASGIVPFLLFITYLLRALWKAAGSASSSHPRLREDQPFRLPLLTFFVLSCISLDYPFAFQWGIVILAVAMSVTPTRPLLRSDYERLSAEGRLKPRYA